MSIAELARHLLEVDEWLFRKLRNPALQPIFGTTPGRAGIGDDEFRDLVERLTRTGRERSDAFARLTAAELLTLLPDDPFGGEVTVWWVIVRGNLDHETHHRGQLATYLRCLSERQG